MHYMTAVLLLLPVALSAQAGSRERSPATNCHGVITSSLASGREHPDYHRCASEAVPFIEEAIRSAGSETRVDRLTLLARLAFFIRDARILEGGLSLAADDAARPAARVLGLLAAVRHVDPIEWHGSRTLPFTQGLSATCSEVVFPAIPEDFHWFGRGIPEDASSRTRAVAESLAGLNEPPLIRDFARCVLMLLPDPADEAYAEIPDWDDEPEVP